MNTTTHTPQPLSFYITGGTVPRDAPSYVERQADTALLEGLRQAQFCYVLTSRQMGKSSLMARTAARLREEGTAVAVLDLTAIGQNLTPEQWYDGLLNLLARALDLEDEMEAFWFARERLSPLQRWMQALQEVVLKQVPGPVVIFIDEIDAVRSLPFSADEFFAAIRECYNRRGEEPEYGRLSFCLLGVASPSDLIRDTRTTPFNIGKRVELSDFTVEEAAPLTAGLQAATPSQVVPSGLLERLLSRVLSWTGGHPYLTQRLCQAVAEGLEKGEAGSTELVDRLCGELFLSSSAQEQDDNLIFVRERLLRSEADLASLLDLYAQVLRGKRIADDETKSLVNVLKLSGVVAAKQGFLAVRNRIYGRVFDSGWVTEHMPDAELRRQKRAYRRGLVKATTVTIILVGGLIATWMTIRYAFEAANARKTVERERALRSLVQQQSDLALARAFRMSGQPGQRFDSLDALANAAALHPSQETRLQLRNEAIADMALPVDLRVQKHLPGVSGFRVIDADPDQGRYFQSDSHGNIEIRRISDDHLLSTLPGFGVGYDAMNRRSPDGRYIFLLYSDHKMILWDCLTGKKVLKQPPIIPNERSIDFSSDSRWAAVTFPDRSIRILSLPDRHERKCFHLSPGYEPNILRLSLDNRRLASAELNRAGVHLLDLSSGSDVVISTPSEVNDVVWHPDGRRLAIACHDHNLYLIDVQTRHITHTLEGHIDEIVQLCFNPEGTLLASSSWDRTVRLWDLQSGKQLLIDPVDAGKMLQFSRDGRRLVGVNPTESLIWEVADSRECRPLGARRDTLWPMNAEFSPDGRLIVSVDMHGVQLWDASSASALGRLELGRSVAAAFRPDGKELITSGDIHLYSWPIIRESATGLIRIGPPRNLAAWTPPIGQYFCQSRDGHVLVVGHQESHAYVLSAGRPQPTLLRSGDRMRYIAISPDGRWIATGPWADSGKVKVWDARTGKLIHDFPAAARTDLAFSPDGRWLVGGCDKYYFWEAGSWQPGPPLQRSPGSSTPAPLDFTLDGRMLAIASSSTLVRLIDPATRREFASLEVPNRIWMIEGIRFSPDGTRLAVAWGDQTIYLWDLRLIRERLAAMSLDWDLPSYPPPGKERNTVPLHVEVIGGETIAQQRSQRYRNQIMEFTAYLQAHPRSKYVPDFLNGIAWCYAAAPEGLRDPVKALPLIQKAVQIKPGVPLWLNTLGVVYYRLGKYEQAIDALRESLQGGSGGSDAHNLFFLAMSYRRLGDHTRANACYDQAVRWWNAHPIREWDQIEELKSFQAEAKALLGRQ